MKTKIFTTTIFILILTVGSVVHFLLSTTFISIGRKHASIIVEGEVIYPYHLPILKGTYARDAMRDFGLLPTSDLDDLYLKVSTSWIEIGGDYVIEQDARLKVGKK